MTKKRIPDKDQNILWGKAAALCSMPNCKEKLIYEANDAIPSSATKIGENCHIVGENKGSARYDSSFTDDEKCRYPNLILLCRNHHKIVDDDPITWTVEKLHEIKSAHEKWVEENISKDDIAEIRNEKWFSRRVVEITNSFNLYNWDIISNQLLNGTVSKKLNDDLYDFYINIFRSNIPTSKKSLYDSIYDLAVRTYEFLQTYHMHSMLNNNTTCYMKDRFYRNRGVFNPNYDKDLHEFNKWEEKTIKLLFNITHALNIFAEQVRENLDSEYFFDEGKFVVYDGLGFMSQVPLSPQYNLPKAFYSEKELSD